MRAKAALLRPGLYLGPRGDTWRHWRQRSPRHLRSSKARARRGGLPRRLAAAVLRLAGLVLPSSYLRVPPVRGGGHHTLVVLASDGGMVLIDPVRARVTRSLPEGLDAAHQIDRRTRWQRWVPAAGVIDQKPPGHVVEQLVQGRHVHDLTPGELLSTLRVVFDSYADLVRAEREEAEGHVDQLARALTTPRPRRMLPAELVDLLESSEMLAAARTWPLVPSGSDNSPDNVVVQDGRPVFIDVFPMRSRLFFAHPCALTISWDRAGVCSRQRFLDGEFDGEAASLLAAAGVELPLDRATRRLLLALSLPVLEVKGDASPAAYERRATWLLEAYGLHRAEAW